MKSALLIENDHVERARLAKILGWIGFQAAPASTPKQALNVAHSIKFNVIVTCTYLLPDDRRALTSELKRLAPEAIIVLLTYDEEEYRKARAGCCPCVNAVLRRPVTLDALWRLVRLGSDEIWLRSDNLQALEERRR